MICPMCGETASLDGYCGAEHRQLHVTETEAMRLRQGILEIVHLGAAGEWWVEYLRHLHTSVPRSSV